MEDKDLKANERKKKFPASLSEIRKAEIKPQDAERKRLKRAEQKTDGETVLKTEERQKKERERKQRYREKKRNNTALAIKMPFKSNQHRGKVLKKIKKALPSSPSKKRFVVREFFQSLSRASQKHYCSYRNWQRII